MLKNILWFYLATTEPCKCKLIFTKVKVTTKKNVDNFWHHLLVYCFMPLHSPNGLQRMTEGWEIDPHIGFPICDHFSWALGYFPKQTKLIWTKNFKALFLSLTKRNRRAFRSMVWSILLGVLQKLICENVWLVFRYNYQT